MGKFPHDGDRDFRLAAPEIHYPSVLSHNDHARGWEEPGWATRPREVLPCEPSGRAELNGAVARSSQAAASKDELSSMGWWLP